MTGSKKTYNFTVILSGVSKPDDRLEDGLYAAGCDDAVLGFRNGVGYLEFDREGISFESAVLSALDDVGRSNHPVTVSHVEPGDLVNLSEIARRLNFTREYVRLLSQGKRGQGAFPAPQSGVTGTTFVWSWVQVLKWLMGNGFISDGSLIRKAASIRDMNLALEYQEDPAQLERQALLARRIQLRDSVVRYGAPTEPVGEDERDEGR